jgi:hypothetical protein
MRQMVVRYQAKPELADMNAQLIKEVFKELHEKNLPGVRYLALRLEDDSFLHFVISEGETNPIPQLDAFRIFQSGVRDRIVEGPKSTAVEVVGNYRMLDSGLD